MWICQLIWTSPHLKDPPCRSCGFPARRISCISILKGYKFSTFCLCINFVLCLNKIINNCARLSIANLNSDIRDWYFLFFHIYQGNTISGLKKVGNGYLQAGRMQLHARARFCIYYVCACASFYIPGGQLHSTSLFTLKIAADSGCAAVAAAAPAAAAGSTWNCSWISRRSLCTRRSGEDSTWSKHRDSRVAILDSRRYSR